MHKKAFHIIIWMFLISSVFFFVLSFFEYREHQKNEQQFEQLQERLREVIPFQFDTVLATLDQFTSGNNTEVKRNEETPSYTALILLNPSVCTACILEVHEYIDIFKSFDPQIQPVIVVLTSDSTSAHRFLQRSMYSTSSYWGQHESLNQVTKITQNMPPVGQLLAFVDQSQNQIFFRSILPTRITSLSYKQNLLEEAFSAYYP